MGNAGGNHRANSTALAGLRILDFTWVWAGPICTMLLADMGAEVIKVESNHSLDVCRVIPPFPERQPGGVNRGGQFNTYNRNKKSCTLNLKDPKGNEIAKRLVMVSDVVVENFSPPVMGRLGLDYEACRTVKPDIIYLSLSGYGATGPNRTFVSYGMQLQAFAGLASLTGYPDGPPRNPGTPISDTVGGLTGVLGILAALRHRNATGQGQNIDVSQCEVLSALCPEAVLDYTMNGRLSRRVGNRDEIMAPHGVYRCKGDDHWISIAVGTDNEWKALCTAIGQMELVDDPRFSDRFARSKNQAVLDDIIAAWALEHGDYEAMHLLQGLGVPASAVLSNSQLIRDPHLMERGLCAEDDHPETGKRMIYGAPWRLSRTPGEVRRHAPLLGEHNEEVLANLLGLGPDEFKDLVEKRVIY